jgi:hypothetical protein
MNRLNDKDPGRPKAITNADEQEVAVNHSTADHGYDEPTNEDIPAKNEDEKRVQDDSKKDTKTGKFPSSQANKKS